jgi:hypothetical protein
MEKNIFQNKAYKAITCHLEKLEFEGKYKGNGHHLSQKLCDLLWEEFKDSKI